ncbi:MAG: hypothetical protein NTV46_13180 [Verrucomicrobia bacterium]|nr:hypothetical protein [Verrucomicrobiota bacterium]
MGIGVTGVAGRTFHNRIPARWLSQDDEILVSILTTRGAVNFVDGSTPYVDQVAPIRRCFRGRSKINRRHFFVFGFNHFVHSFLNIFWWVDFF